MSEKKVITCTLEGKTTEGFVERRDLPMNERVLRGLKIGGLLWLVAFFTIFIPILHFFLPPLFLLLGIVFGFASWYSDGEITSGEYTCPSCVKTNALPKQDEDFPISVRCEHCFYDLKLAAK